jgi:hypothetical protein
MARRKSDPALGGWQPHPAAITRIYSPAMLPLHHGKAMELPRRDFGWHRARYTGEYVTTAPRLRTMRIQRSADTAIDAALALCLCAGLVQVVQPSARAGPATPRRYGQERRAAKPAALPVLELRQQLTDWVVTAKNIGPLA